MNLREKPFYLNEEKEAWVKDTLQHMTLEQKAGQLFCVMGEDTPEERLSMVKDYHVGGMLFRPNKKEDLLEWFAPLDEAAEIPLLKAANLEEGGYGALSDATYFASQMQVAATDDVEMAKKLAAVCAVEAMAAGINLSYSPVCDINLNYQNPITAVRTFGSDPKRVQAMTGAFAAEMQKYGMAACPKHFPGDGVDYRDQHLHPTYNSLDSAEWYRTYGAIYQNLIDEGVLCIMAGHIVQPALEQEVNPDLRFEDCMPATLSPELLQGVLRDKLHFNGLITSDATIMGGFCQVMERRLALPAMVMAGCDMIVFNTDFYEDYQIILDGVKNGLLTEERLNEAVTRILALKAKVCGVAAPAIPDEIREWREDCADRAVTLVKDTAGYLPLSVEQYPLMRLIVLGKDDTADGSLKEMAKKAFEEEGFRVELYDPSADETLRGPGSLPEGRVTVYFTNYVTASNQVVVRPTWYRRHALDAPRYLCEEPTVFVSFANPYLLQDVPRVKTYINAYTATEATVHAVVEKLMGRSAFVGHSPVDPFCGLPDTHI